MTIHLLRMRLCGMFYCDCCPLQNLTGTYRYSEMNVTDLGFSANLALGILQSSSQRKSVGRKLDVPKQSTAVYHRLSAGPGRLDQQGFGNPVHHRITHQRGRPLSAAIRLSPIISYQPIVYDARNDPEAGGRIAEDQHRLF